MVTEYRNCLSPQENAWLERVWGQTVDKVTALRDKVGTGSPHRTTDGRYDSEIDDWWTSGFWPGMLWLMHDMTGAAHWRDQAWDWDARIERTLLRNNRLHHDVGFQFLPTAVIKYTLTGDPDARRRALQMAAFLAGRFNLSGRFLRAWNGDMTGWAIIDTCMNLPLLMWASRELKDPRFAQVACAHADTVLRVFQREDGSVRHIVSFDPESGAFLESFKGQGYASESAWSRGQSWAIHGLAVMFRETGDQRYQKAAVRAADFFLSRLRPDGVSDWDGKLEPGAPGATDTSATCCAASGLLELAAGMDGENGRIYTQAAIRMLRALDSGYATWNMPEQEGLILGGTIRQPGEPGTEVSLIYGDYYFAEALAKLKGWKHRIF